MGDLVSVQLIKETLAQSESGSLSGDFMLHQHGYRPFVPNQASMFLHNNAYKWLGYCCDTLDEWQALGTHLLALPSLPEEFQQQLKLLLQQQCGVEKK